MTNENEVEWWKEEPYMTRGPYSDFYHFEKIVAEAMRLGEVKAWSEAKGMLEAEQRRIDSFHRNGYVFNVSIEIIDAKLTSLKTL